MHSHDVLGVLLLPLDELLLPDYSLAQFFYFLCPGNIKFDLLGKLLEKVSHMTNYSFKSISFIFKAVMVLFYCITWRVLLT